jgi:hypothetical protein
MKEPKEHLTELELTANDSSSIISITSMVIGLFKSEKKPGSSL